MLEIEVIECSENSVGRSGELKDDETAAWLKDSRHLRKAFLEVLEIADTKSHSYGIEPIGRERERLGVRHTELNIISKTGIVDFLLADLNHLWGDVATNYVAIESLVNLYGHIGGTCSYVKELLGLAVGEECDCLGAPPAVDTEREHVVEEIVVGRDAVEHTLDLLTLVVGLLIWFYFRHCSLD